MATADDPSDVGRKVWNRIEDRRLELGMPKYKLAELVGVERTAFYKWRDKLLAGRNVGNENLTKLERALQFPYGELLRLAGKPAPALPGSTSPVSVAIVNAVELERHEKETLLRVYESFMANKRRPPPSPE